MRNDFQITGFIVYPTALITNPSLDCNLCREKTCAFHFPHWNILKRRLRIQDDDPKYDRWWVNKYCTHSAKADHYGVEDFIQYFPYAMIIIPLTLVMIEQTFAK